MVASGLFKMSKKKKKDIVYPLLQDGCQLIDTHCHLDMEAYQDDVDVVILNAEIHGIKRIITVGIDYESSRAAIILSEKYPGVYATVGVHPHNVSALKDSDYENLATLASNPKVVAYGEIGLDFYYDYAPVDVQIEHFTRQVNLAKQLDLPLVIHDRDAHEEVLEVLSHAYPFPVGGVMHCFSGDHEFARKVIELGFYVSIPGVVTFKKAEDLQNAVREVPLDKLILETDGPFLAPEPRRGRRNEPGLLLFTAKKVAELKGVRLEEVASITTVNAEKLFRLPKI